MTAVTGGNDEADDGADGDNGNGVDDDADGEKDGAAATLAAALRFSELLADPANHGRCRLSMHDTGRYVRLDSSALRALNVLPERTSASARGCAEQTGAMRERTFLARP